MDDDFNTPVAVAALFDLASEVNRAQVAGARRATEGAGRLARAPRTRPADVPAARCPRQAADAGADARIEDAIAARIAAKREKDFAEADRIRARSLTTA